MTKETRFVTPIEKLKIAKGKTKKEKVCPECKGKGKDCKCKK